MQKCSVQASRFPFCSRFTTGIFFITGQRQAQVLRVDPDLMSSARKGLSLGVTAFPPGLQQAEPGQRRFAFFTDNDLPLRTTMVLL